MRRITAKQLLKDNKEIQRIANLLRRVLENASNDGEEFTPVTFEALSRLQDEITVWRF